MPGLPAISEKDFQDQVVQLAQLGGWLVYHTFDSRRSAGGFPDLVLVRGAELIFAELKTDAGRIRPEQDEWLLALERVARGVDDATDHLIFHHDASATASVEVHVWRPHNFDEIQARLARVPTAAGREAAR